MAQFAKSFIATSAWIEPGPTKDTVMVNVKTKDNSDPIGTYLPHVILDQIGWDVVKEHFKKEVREIRDLAYKSGRDDESHVVHFGV